MTPTPKPARNPDACVDCGVTDAAAMFTQQATVLGRVRQWRVCSRCILKRGDLAPKRSAP